MASSAEKVTVTSADEPEIINHAKRADTTFTTRSDSLQSLPSPRLLQRASTIPLLSSASSTTTSPKPSREASPVRPLLRSGSAAVSRGARSRKNSQELSPNRALGSNIPAVPSAAAIQRAFSAVGVPQLQSSAGSDFSFEATRSQKPSKAFGSGNNPPGLNLQRTKSPPPSTLSNKASIHSPRKFDQTSLTPSIILERSSPISGPILGIDEAEKGNLVASGMRTPARGSSVSGPTLETVQESSVPATPAIGITKPQHGSKARSDDRQGSIAENSREEDLSKATKTMPESSSDSGGNKSTEATKETKHARKPDSVGNYARPQIMHPKKSFTQLHLPKSKTAAEGSIKNMTVETETVSTIPQVALGGGAGERTVPGRTEVGGSLRLKPSNETIRPRKDKKKVVRKAPSLNSGTGGSLSKRLHHHHIYSRAPSPEPTVSLSTFLPDFALAHAPVHDHFPTSLQSSNLRHTHVQGTGLDFNLQHANSSFKPSSALLTNFRGRTASSKADIFEAKVASAVDEVNSSDSEETFVYESNPPEPLSARPHRFHSRTPSATSMVSQADQYGGKGRQDGHHSIAGKKSMKFANNSYHTTAYPGDANDGTIRGPGQTGRPSGGNTSHHHHIGRYGRGGHTSLFDTESPFPNAARPLRTATNNVARLSSRPSSPRSSHVARVSGNLRKPNEPMLYDLEGEGADDERTPLVGSVRSGRNRYSRRPVPGAIRNGYASEEKRPPLCRRLTAAASFGTLLALLVVAIVIILLMCSKSLYDVHVKDIRNVLASEQELMLDINVHAVNPNIIAVQVSDLDVNIFAKSKHVGTNALWRSDQSHHNANLEVKSTRSREASLDRTHHHQLTSSTRYHLQEGIDEGTDPIDDPETDSQTMLLGRIFEFDSPLIFEPSPIRHYSLSSIGELRLAKPGNRTEDGGTERWEKVIQHDFELIVRGVLRYSLPLSSKTRSASIAGSILVHPGGGEERMDSMRALEFRRPPFSVNKDVLQTPHKHVPNRIHFVT